MDARREVRARAEEARPRGTHPARRMAVVLPLGMALAALALYTRTAARTITWGHGGGDGPELSAVAAVLGIAHPPGYPLYTLIGHLFTLLPFGEVAFRMALFSAVSAALGVALAARLASSLSSSFEGRPPRWPVLVAGLAAGAALAASPLYWSQATIAEVYSLHALFMLGALNLLASWRAGRDRLLLALALLFGLGMAHHLTTALLAVFAVVLVVVLDPGVLRRRVLLLAPAAFLLGLLVYLYLPLRAAADPPLNWGDPSDFPRFLYHVTASAYRGYLGGRPLGDVLMRVPMIARLLGDQLTWPGLVLALLGLGELMRSRPPFARLLVGYALTSALFALLYNADNGEVYLMPVALVLAVGMGLGVAYVANRVASPRVALLLAIALPVWQLCWNWPTMDLSGDRTAAIYARETLESALPGTVLLTERDEQTFVLWYEQVVNGTRPDVVVVDQRLRWLDWYRAQMEERHPGTMTRVLP